MATFMIEYVIINDVFKYNINHVKQQKYIQTHIHSLQLSHN